MTSSHTSSISKLSLAQRLGLVPQVGLTLALGMAGMLFARWARLPGGLLIGAMLFSATARLLNAPMAEPPNCLKIASRTILGLTIGARVTPNTLSAIAEALLPMTLMIVAIVCLGIVIARTIHRLAHMPLPTALCGSAPGGLAAMVSLADALSGEGAVVASMHLIRLISVTLLVPALVQGWFAPVAEIETALPAQAAATPPDLLWRLAVLALVGLAFGSLAEWRKVPSGSLIVGMFVAATLNPLWLHLPTLPSTWTYFAQLIIGAGVGVTMTRSTLRNFRPYALAGALMTVTLILSGLGLGWVLYRITSLDLVTAIMGCSPGGADTMMLLSVDLGAEPQIVAAMHVTRMIMLTALLPLVIKLAAGKQPGQVDAAPAMAE